MTNMNQNGRSMIEMLGVLAIIGVLSVGGIAGYSKAMLKFRTNKTIDQFTMIVTNIRTLYAQQNDYDGLNNATAVSMGIIPDGVTGNVTPASGTQGQDGYKPAHQNLTNPFNGTVEITTGNSTGNGAADGTNRAFLVTYTGLPKTACLEMAVSDWGSNYSSGLIGMAISKTSGQVASAEATYTRACSSSDAVVCAADMPIEVADAANYCDCAGTDCSISFKYY